LLKTLEGHKGQIRSIVFQSDGRLFYSAGFDGTIQSWHFPSGLAARPPVLIGNEIFSLLLSTDNKTLIFTSANRTCHILPIQAQKPVQSILELDGIPLALAINRRQKLAIATRNATIQQFSLSSLKSLLPPSFTTASPINHLVFHPDLPLLFGMGLDGKLYIWHEDDFGHLLSVEAHHPTGCGLGLTPDGDKLVSCSNDGTVIVWDLQPFLLFFQPLHSDPHRWIEKIDHYRKKELQPSTRLWLDFARGLLQWRARYDIQIEEADALQIGEYDILL
jgi:WD40 repeat protein